MKNTSLWVGIVSLTMSTAFAQFPGGGGGGGGQPGGGGGNQPGGSGTTFTFDTFLTDATTSGSAIHFAGLWTGYTNTVTALVVPAGVTNAVAGVMANCATLTSANLSAATTMTELPDYAFAGCGALTTVTLPATVTAIGEGCFDGCSNLVAITATGLTDIGANAFRGCVKLTAIPSAADTIGDFAFAQSGLKTAKLADLTIGDGVCAGCTSLTTATFDADVPDATFSGCTSLSCDLSACASIGQAAFAGNPATTITLSSDVGLDKYSLAADTATLATSLTYDGDTIPDSYGTTFLGRSLTSYYTPAEGQVCRAEAKGLVDWLELNNPLTSYTTAAVEAWLSADAANGLAYAYAAEYKASTSFQPLTISGTEFVWVAQDAGTSDAVNVSLLGSYALGSDVNWETSNLTQDSTDLTHYTMAIESSKGFARLAVAPAW